jgi:hypothetical protein
MASAAISVLLLERGWHADPSPAKRGILVLAGATLEPFAKVRAIADGTVTADDWKHQCTSLRIAGHQLGRMES